MNTEIYKDRYDFEWSHKTQILEITNICIAVATIIGSGVVAEAQAFDYDSNMSNAFLTLLLINSVSLLLALYFIFRAIVGYGYSHIPTPSSLEPHHNNLIIWCSQNGHPPEYADELFSKYLNKRIAEAVDVNLENNVKKSAYNQKAIYAIFSSIIILFINTIIFVMVVTKEENQIHKVKITNPLTIKQEEVKMALPPNSSSQTSNSSSPSSTPSQPQAPVPEGPVNIIIKEHQEMPAKPVMEEKKS